MSARYWELTVSVPDEASEGLTNFVWELGALGVVEEEAVGARPRVRAFFPDTAHTGDLAGRVDAYLASLDVLGFRRVDAASVTPIADEDWAEAWRAHFAPFAVGRRLLVAPPWETPVAGHRTVLAIEPGRAFGTGQHGSTAGCLLLLESVLERARPDRAIDAGTGSGILAIAAARLGVPSVLAVDTDPDAVASATANVQRNGLGDRVVCRVDDVSRLDVPPAPLVVANLLAAAHHALAARYAALVTPGGSLLLGGMLDAEADGVAATLIAHGLHRRDARSVEGWTSIECERAPLRHHP